MLENHMVLGQEEEVELSEQEIEDFANASIICKDQVFIDVVHDHGLDILSEVYKICDGYGSYKVKGELVHEMMRDLLELVKERT
jgi:hypothetical protein